MSHNVGVGVRWRNAGSLMEVVDVMPLVETLNGSVLLSPGPGLL